MKKSILFLICLLLLFCQAEGNKGQSRKIIKNPLDHA